MYPYYGKKGYLTQLRQLQVVMAPPKQWDTQQSQKRNAFVYKRLKSELETTKEYLPDAGADSRGGDERRSRLRDEKKEIAQNEDIANDTSMDDSMRERAREKVNESVERRAKLEREQKRLEEGLSLRKRVVKCREVSPT